MNFWKKSEMFSPLLCRLLARSSPYGPPLTDEEIAARVGLSAYQVGELSQQLDWTGVDLPTMRKFIDACGVNFEDPTVYRRMMVYLKGKKVRGGIKMAPRFYYLREHPDWKSVFRPLMVRYRNAKLGSQTVSG